MPQKTKTLVFLSHSADDAEAAKKLGALLRDAGIDVWLDMERLKPGDLWMPKIESAIDEADALIVWPRTRGGF